MTYESQFRCDPTIQYFRLYYSSEFKYESGEVIEPDISHTRNKLTLNEGNICVVGESYLDTVFMVQVATYLYSKYLKLSCIGVNNMCSR